MSTYILFGQQISFSEAQDRYSRLVSAYINALFATTTEFTTWYHACGSIEKVLQGYVSEADRLISKYVNGPLYEQLLDLEIYDVGKETYRDDCMVLEPAQTACRKFKGLIQKVNDAKDAEIEYRELRKQNRSRVVGGGFGLSGALKGMATAGAINAIVSSMHLEMSDPLFPQQAQSTPSIKMKKPSTVCALLLPIALAQHFRHIFKL